MKVQIIGYSGSGKSTFAKRLGEFYKIPYLHIDAIHFGPNWVERDNDIVEKEIEDFITQENWVIDGQYFRLATKRFDDCDYLFFFDFNRFKCLYGAFKRYCKYRGKNRESIANGCEERLNWNFIKWIMIDGRTKNRRLRYDEIKEKFQGKVIVFKTRKQVNRYLRSIGYQENINY